MRRGNPAHLHSFPRARGSRAAAWRELPGTLRAYVAAICVIGIGLIAWSLPTIVQTDATLLAVLFFLSIPVSRVKVGLPGTASTLSMSHVLGYLALFTLGTPAAILVTAASAWSQCTFRSDERSPIYKTLFSIAALALAMAVAGTVYGWLGGRHDGWTISTAIVPFVATATLFFALNTCLVATAIKLTTGEQPLFQLWCDTFLPTWPAYVLGAAVSAASVFAIERSGLWLVLFLMVPFAVAFYNLRAYLERENEATTDGLTTVANHRFGSEHAERELSRAKRHGTGMTIIVVDLDGLKSLNDRFGHRAGDLVLRHVARCMDGCLRSHDFCARYGGDEFVAILGNCSLASGQAKALELQAAVGARDIEVRPGVFARPGISVGAAAYPEDGASLEGLIETADARMYDDKLRRRSRTA